MKVVRPFVVLALVAAAFSTTSALQSQSPKPGAWPPGLQQVSEESPALSPEAEAKTFFLPPGYHAELVASEPMVEDPILIDWDANGRLWVIEMIGYMQDLPATNERAPVGRISVLEDTNRDGKMDKKTVFLDGLVLPRALKVLDKGVLVGEPPHLWLAQDTNGDLKADKKELVCDCYGTELGNVEHNENSLLWAMDNWMHTSEGDTYFRYKDGKMETRKTLSRGQWGASQDDFGRVYRNSNSSALHIDLLSTPYFLRNPNLLRTRGSYEFMGDPDELNATYPVRPNKGVNRGYQTGQLRGDGTLATYTGVNSPMVYRGDRLPAELAATCSSPSPQAISSAGSSSMTMAPRCAARRRTRMPSSWRRQTSDSGPCICPRHPTARSTSWTSTTASFRRRASSPSTCEITSSRTSSSRRSTWDESGESCTTRRGATDRQHLDPNRPHSWLAGSVTRMAGGEMKRSSY